jgi:hypothetical protein
MEFPWAQMPSEERSGKTKPSLLSVHEGVEQGLSLVRALIEKTVLLLPT